MTENNLKAALKRSRFKIVNYYIDTYTPNIIQCPLGRKTLVLPINYNDCFQGLI